MPGLLWKRINGKRYLVLRWKKRINGKLKIIREVYIGDIDKLADIIQNSYRKLDVTNLDIKGKNSDSDRHIIGDIRDRDTVERAATGKDYVFHLDATTSPPEFEDLLGMCYETNIVGTYNVLAVALQSVRKTKIFMISSLAALISNFILSFLLIPRMHLIGAAIGFSSINIASFFILLYYVKKYSIFEYERLKIEKIYTSAAVMFMVIFTAENLFHFSIAKLFLFIIMGFAIYIIMIKVFGTFSNDDMEFLMQLVPVKLRKYRRVAEIFLLGYGIRNVFQKQE